MKIFISYRRDDTGGHAGRLFDHLTARFGIEHVFMDIDTIQPGEDFRNAIENAVGSCDVVLVMIGRQWLNIMDTQGQRRLDDPRDFVRTEVASALANPKVRVIPVLVRGAGMPSANDLPDNLKDLAWRNATDLSDSRFQYDSNKLIGVIEKIGTEPVKKNQVGGMRKFSSATVGWVFLGITTLGLLFWIVSSGVIGLPKTSTATPTSVIESTSTNTLAPSTPTVAVTATVTENPISVSVQAVDQYFKYINNAGVADDLKRAWDLLTSKLQCNKSDQCNFSTYQEFWWKEQVKYKLYDCGSNIVAAELIYYSRNTTPDLNRTPVYLSYELVEQNGQLKLNSATITTGISAYCDLVRLIP